MIKKTIRWFSLLLISTALLSAEMKTLAIHTNLMGEASKLEFQTSSQEIQLTLQSEEDSVYNLRIQIDETEIEGRVKLTVYFTEAIELKSGVTRNFGFEGLEALLSKGEQAVLYKKDTEHFTLSLR